MSAYMIFNFSVTNPDGYEKYLAGPSTLPPDAEVVVGDYESEPIEGAPGSATFVLRFASRDAARAWYESDAYQAMKPHRTSSSEGVVVLCAD